MSLTKEHSDAGGFLRTLTIRDPQGSGIVFGLDWMPLVGGVPERLGQRRARIMRATHYLVTGLPTSVVGCGVLSSGKGFVKREKFRKVSAYYSAAALFAAAHPTGVIAAIYFLEQKGFWMVASNMGVVLAQTDRWFAQLSDVEVVLASLVSRFPAMKVLTLLNLQDGSLPAWIDQSLMSKARLQRVAAISNVALRVGFYLLLLGAAMWLWSLTTSNPLPEKSSVDPALQWEESLLKFFLSHPVHSSDNLTTVFEAWYRAPVHSGGWGLNQIICESFGPDWQCAARYRRQHRRALNQQLEAVKPEGWELEVTDLDHAMLKWTILGAARPFEPVSPTVSLKEWISHLQSVTPVFESIQIGSGSALTFPAPMDQNGLTLPRPPQSKSLKRRSITIKGPLRSMPALRGLTIPVRWRSVHLKLGAVQGQGISQSELMVQLQGEIFEISE